ncbi:MAG: hypothetical protein A2Y94_01545 [Caldithrix sp. RBG_13_44_9]|nr:MAG: hypothetical protein A2Y94_01545 [Caldithrix sp. RBG_13_44_9]
MNTFVRKYLAVILFLTFNNLYAYNWLWVEDPKMPWRDGQGTIEEAVISVRPQGIYMEYGLYLTFSARNLNFSNLDTLEVQFYFELPEESIVRDSWLWVGEDIIRAIIMDKWTASTIYDTIVDRRQDPSILLKQSSSQYELRIFPMVGNETRKVKITYLVPTQWNLDCVTAPLPTNLLRTSKYPLTALYLLTWLDPDWQNPQIVEYPNINFQFRSDTLYGEYYQAGIPQTSLQLSLNYAVDAPLNNGIYINKFEGGSENLYQLAFVPSLALNIEAPVKLAVLFDYDVSNSDISKSDVINTVRANLHANLAENDSFNLIFTQLNIYRVSEDWIPADSLSIENTFASIPSNPLADYSNLPSLLSNGIEFVNNQGHDGSLLLVSNSDMLGDFQVANDIIDDLLNLMDPVLPIHVADYQTKNYPYYWVGGRSWYGNEYFYTNITRLTSANYYRMINSGYTFSQIISSCFQSLSGFISSFDLYTTLQNGFCYGRFYLNPLSYTTYLNRPILQIGKFYGTFPFIIQASGIYQNEPFSQQILVPESNILSTDSTSEEMWVGNYISSLESQNQTNTIISEIIDQSINERVISIYTAFLCLDPERGGEVCYDCFDETQLVGIQEMDSSVDDDSLLQAHPNPFNSHTTIKFSFKENANLKDMSFKIFNILGQVVRSFKPDVGSAQRKIEFDWDGTSDSNTTVATGTYFFMVQSPEKQYTIKLLLIK